MNQGHRHNNHHLEAVEGVIDGVRFRSPESGFTVLVATIGGVTESLVGELAGEVEKGAMFRAQGRWAADPKFGRQFRFETLEVKAPTTTEQVVARLKTYPGIGPSTAEKIVEQFGDQTWEVMDRSIDDLLHIPGVGPKALAKVRTHHHRQNGPVAQVKNRLIAVGAPPHLAKGVHEEFGARAVKMLEDHPYKVATRVERFGFKTAEMFARATGLDPEDPERVEAGVVHALRMQRSQGHCGMPPEDLKSVAASFLGVRVQAVDAGVERLASCGALRRCDGMMFLSNMDRVEARVATAVAGIARPVRGVWDADQTPATLSPGQREAVAAVARSGVTVLTGGPGTGKSTVVAAVLEMAKRAGCDVTLCAPTGRAAKRLTEATGQDASTIHRLLRPIPGSKDFHHDESNPLPAGLVVVDEVSMVDIELADALFGALTREHRVLLVGDADQLPSVGPGNLLLDLLDAAESEAVNISVVRLEQVFRQAEGSTIITNAHRLLAGIDPESDDPGLGSAGQFYVVAARTPEEAHAKIVQMAAVRVPLAYDVEPTDVQILCPVHRGPAGTEAFNAKLQQRYAGRNADSFWGPGGRRFCVDDRVMQVRNDYERNVFNGDIGTVVALDETFMTVDFDGAQSKYKRYGLDTLKLAYAMTIHKSQGGEFPAVLVPMLSENRRFNRNLLYTAITRAKRLCVLVGHREAITRAVQTVATRRWTRLSHRIISTT